MFEVLKKKPVESITLGKNVWTKHFILKNWFWECDYLNNLW